MAEYTRISQNGSRSAGTLHPEIAEGSLACLKRDLRRLRQTKGKSFLRRPYTDLQEAQMIALDPDSPPSALIVGIGVFPIIKGDTNARVPMTAEHVQDVIAKGELVDLWSAKGFA